MKKLKGKLSISRIKDMGDGFMKISLKDEGSRIEFVKAKVSFANFCKAITGQGEIPIEFEVRGLDVVGKIREQKELIFEIPNGTKFFRHKDYAKKNCQEHAEEGWKARGYYKSQSSIQKKNDKYYAVDLQYRYVERKD